jgi:anti-sigma B factor antagonist
MDARDAQERRPPMATLTITPSTYETWGVLTVDGELDLSTSPDLRDALYALATGHERIAIDLSAVTFMDSTALGVIVAGMKRARERGGELALIGPTGSPRKVLSITALDQIVPIVEDPAGLAGVT